MKKMASPLVICRRQNRKQNPTLDDYISRKYNNQKHRKHFSGLNDYIKTAARKVGRFFSAFLFREKTENSTGDQVESNKTHCHSEEISSSSQRRYSSRHRRSSSYASSEIETGYLRIKLSLEGIYKATRNFSPANKIGEGGFGTVYKAQLENGLTVAVKRAKVDKYNPNMSEEFKNEILALSKIEHINLVRLYGYVEHAAERIVVVEYVSNGTLREHLDGKRGNGLDITERLDIATDIAHAITYLHTYTGKLISFNHYREYKLRAKVADFGFARLGVEDPRVTHISTQVKGTAGYLDPEYVRTYQLTEKSDVYSFGVLLVEIITGRNPIESKRRPDERITTRWALKRLKDGEAVVAMDPNLRRNGGSIQAVEKVLKLARQCLAPSRQSRPSMRICAEVLWGIRKELREISSLSSAASFHSGNLIETHHTKSRQNLFGIEGSDSLMFVSL
ncbi:calmodulin-binding receptor-like cytoplasmic kinase 1 [Olea europaea subsp. europaea]|uniref:Calmodulin-binding receptor-like cytoplasmic kinase 1 n=1 Tax=Olea europaea subsp. europaea TaxID=158383 RepID=A0A8S0TVF6_OLEEU|nr:calmodulin-binding receptor-like cytoplasmic kinase 1 [Olea europaea subsp. europaea]